jgi:hypothetical protein
VAGEGLCNPHVDRQRAYALAYRARLFLLCDASVGQLEAYDNGGHGRAGRDRSVGINNA